MNWLLVERNADWSQWTSISRLLGTAVLVRVQQADEPSCAFHERVLRRLERGKPPTTCMRNQCVAERCALIPAPAVAYLAR